MRVVCPVCAGDRCAGVIDIFQVPVHCNLLWPAREEALQAPRGDILLAFCRNCGHIFNRAFEPALMVYNQAYENSLHFSPRFQNYAEDLAKHLIECYDLRHKDIIEIGCGKGEFLKLLCKLGPNRGFGFDPSYVPEQNNDPGQIVFIQDFYSTRYADYKADLVCCRHVLEHIQDPREFLADIRCAIEPQPGTVLFFEVPNGLYSLRDLGIWDLIYEHCSYFSFGSLAYLFTASGFKLNRLAETYGAQFLSLEALSGQDIKASQSQVDVNLAEMNLLVAAFADKYRQKVESWRHRLEVMRDKGQRVVVWGGGSKGVTFLNVLKTQDQIRYVVDLNPRKQGMHVAGTGQQIVPPEFLKEYHPDVIIVMNPIYTDEIRQMCDDMSMEAALHEV